MKNRAMITAGIVFFLLAAAQTLRYFFKWNVTIGTLNVAPGFSAAAAAVFFGLSLMMFKAAKEADSQAVKEPLSIEAFAKAAALIWAFAVLFVALINLAVPNYGESFLEMMGSLYFWYPVTHTPLTALLLGGLALIDGAIAGALFALIYNAFLPRNH